MAQGHNRTKHGRNKKRYASRVGAGLRHRHGDRTGTNRTQTVASLMAAPLVVCECTDRHHAPITTFEQGEDKPAKVLVSHHHVHDGPRGKLPFYVNKHGEQVIAFSLFKDMRYDALCAQLGLATISKRRVQVA